NGDQVLAEQGLEPVFAARRLHQPVRKRVVELAGRRNTAVEGADVGRRREEALAAQAAAGVVAGPRQIEKAVTRTHYGLGSHAVGQAETRTEIFGIERLLAAPVASHVGEFQSTAQG